MNTHRVKYLLDMFNSASAEVDRAHRLATLRREQGNSAKARYYQYRAAQMHGWANSYRDEYQEAVRDNRHVPNAELQEMMK